MINFLVIRFLYDGFFTPNAAPGKVKKTQIYKSSKPSGNFILIVFLSWSISVMNSSAIGISTSPDSVSTTNSAFAVLSSTAVILPMLPFWFSIISKPTKYSVSNSVSYNKKKNMLGRYIDNPINSRAFSSLSTRSNFIIPAVAVFILTFSR